MGHGLLRRLISWGNISFAPCGYQGAFRLNLPWLVALWASSQRYFGGKHQPPPKYLCSYSTHCISLLSFNTSPSLRRFRDGKPFSSVICSPAASGRPFLGWWKLFRKASQADAWPGVTRCLRGYSRPQEIAFKTKHCFIMSSSWDIL